jgi:hypothetical protein
MNPKSIADPMPGGATPMDVNEIKIEAQRQMEARGVPMNTAREAAEILAQENALALSGQPVPKRTQEQQHIVSSAWHWFRAKNH